MAKRVMTQAAQAALDHGLQLPPEERSKVFESLYDSLDTRPSTRPELDAKPMLATQGKSLKAGCLSVFRTSPDFDEPLDFMDRAS